MKLFNFLLMIIIQFMATMTLAFSDLNIGLKVALITLMWGSAVIVVNTSGRD